MQNGYKQVVFTTISTDLSVYLQFKNGVFNPLIAVFKCCKKRYYFTLKRCKKRRLIARQTA